MVRGKANILVVRGKANILVAREVSQTKYFDRRVSHASGHTEFNSFISIAKSLNYCDCYSISEKRFK